METNRENVFDYADDQQFQGKTAPEIFTGIFKENIWKNEESVSGLGSSLEQTSEIIKLLPGVLTKYNIKSILDIPCGDFNWMQQINLDGIFYTGADIVKELIDANNQKYAADYRRFMHLNLIEDEFEEYDLVFCRDCLVHLSFEDIFSSLKNIKSSSSKYFITTTFTGQKENKNIHTGGWRPLNFQKAPFNFPEPLYLLNEKCTEADGMFTDKSLGLWKVEDI